MLNYWPSVWGIPLADSSSAKLVLFTVNEIFLYCMGDELTESQEWELCCPCTLAQFFRHSAQKVSNISRILRRERNYVNNLTSFVHCLYYSIWNCQLLHLSLLLDGNVLSKVFKRFVHVRINDNINSLMKFWEIIPGVSLVKKVKAGGAFLMEQTVCKGWGENTESEGSLQTVFCGEYSWITGGGEEWWSFRQKRPITLHGIKLHN